MVSKDSGEDSSHSHSFYFIDVVKIMMMIRGALRHPALRRRREVVQGQVHRATAFSTKPQEDPKEEQVGKQPFVVGSIEPGEWDPARKDPLYRPKFKSNAKIISAEDFANRPPVTFSGEFVSYQDAMVTLSWMDQKTCRTLYRMYVDMMVLSHQNHERTSHEYVTKLLAQKFNITPWRAAGIIQLQHNEEQMRRNNPELLADEEANYAEQKIMENIRDAYKTEYAEAPDSFVEDPVGMHGRGDPDETSSFFVRADDLFDVEQKLKEASIRDQEDARVMIDNHIYVEDRDDNKVQVKADSTVHKLIKKKKNLAEKSEVKGETTIPYPETNGEGVKRPRWKYVAKMVDTRSRRRKGKHYKTYTNANTENTVVEQEGELRVATVEESKHVAWKRTRHGNEHIYAGAKRAWIEKIVNQKTDVWGPAPAVPKPPPTPKEDPPVDEDSSEVQVEAAGEDVSEESSEEAAASEQPKASEEESSESPETAAKDDGETK